MSSSSISKFLYGTGIIGVLLGIPQLEALPNIFYRHYYLFPTISFIMGLIGGLDIITKYKKKYNSSIILPDQLLNLKENQKQENLKRKRILFVITLIVIYIVTLSLCFYEYDFKKIESITPVIPTPF